MQPPSPSVSHHTATFHWRDRLGAAGIHLALSAVVAALAALLVFALWYPWPYRDISGGRELFLLVVGVDVVLGPLITFAIFDRAKPRRELRRDLTLVGLLQFAGLLYGLWSVELARPVHMVFEIDRMRVVHRADIPEELESRAPAGIEVAPLWGPTLIAARELRGASEQMEATMMAVQGLQIGFRPELWEAYDAARPRVLRAARPVSELQRRFPGRAAEIDAALQEAGRSAASTAYLPLIARKARAGTVLLDAGNADVVGYVPLDSF